MTVETTDRKQNFAGGQAELEFSFKALVGHPEDIKVSEIITSTGETEELVYNLDYSVALNADGIGGIVTVSPTFSTLYTQVVYRETTLTQESDYEDYNQFPADTLENNLDQLTLIAQEQAEEVSRTLKYPISESGASVELPIPEADAFLAWNSDADALVNKDIPDPATLVKASQAEAEAATNDTAFMTPLKVKNEVQKSGAVSIPIANITENANIIKDTGNQTIAGVKTFSSFPITPSSAPTTDYQAANKKYVDDAEVDTIETIVDCGTNTNYASGTARSPSAIKMCYGGITIAGGSSTTLTNLPFTLTTSYKIIVCFAGDQSYTEAVNVLQQSASQVTIWNNSALSANVNWFAIGI
jgi:hypothetical protein